VAFWVFVERPLSNPVSNIAWSASGQPKGDEKHTFEGGNATVTIYHVTLRDRETQTVVGYYNGAWTTDPRRALPLRRREAAEAHAASMRDRCPRNAELITVEEMPPTNG
jgi:hypothetical protein